MQAINDQEALNKGQKKKIKSDIPLKKQISD